MISKTSTINEDEYLHKAEEALKAIKQDFSTVKAYITQVDKRQAEMIHIFENRFYNNVLEVDSLVKDLTEIVKQKK